LAGSKQGEGDKKMHNEVNDSESFFFPNVVSLHRPPRLCTCATSTNRVNSLLIPAATVSSI
jgi:hypothetical protein